jgi:DNA-binding NarL/FixJ family response regulator
MGSQANINLIKRAVNNAVTAYILKEADLSHLDEIVRKVHEGENYFNPSICTMAFHTLADLLQKHSDGTPQKDKDFNLPISELSKTEVKILAFLGKGYPDKEIANKLHLSTGTIRNYISQVTHKTGLKNRTQAAVYAIQNGLSDPS